MGYPLTYCPASTDSIRGLTGWIKFKLILSQVAYLVMLIWLFFFFEGFYRTRVLLITSTIQVRKSNQPNNFAAMKNSSLSNPVERE